MRVTLKHAVVEIVILQSFLVLANNGPYNPNVHSPQAYSTTPGPGGYQEVPFNGAPEPPPHYSNIPSIEQNEGIPPPGSPQEDVTSSLFIPATSTSQRQLFGSDLSQIDKDFIFEGLKTLYKKKVLPLELATKYSHFGSPPMGPSDFEAKPMVLVLGQVAST